MRISRVLGVVLLSVAVQVVLARYAVGGRFVFDIVLVGVVFAALASGAVGGMLAGTVGGLLQDLASGGIVGVSGLLKTLVGCAAGVLGTQFVVAKPYARALIVAAATLVNALLAAGLQGLIHQQWPGLAGAAILEELALNAGVAYFAFALADSLPGAVARSRSRQRSTWARRRW
jgi:rod shape-determining protein MreD